MKPNSSLLKDNEEKENAHDVFQKIVAYSRLQIPRKRE